METRLRRTTIQIQILSITPVDHPTKTVGKTTPKLDIAYKNLSFNGKVEGKGLFSFGSQEGAFKVLKNSQPGDVYDIERVKEGEFQNWVSAKKSDGSSNPVLAAVSGTGTATSTAKSSGYQLAPKSTYPTEDERAKTQIYIVRQSNLNTAVATLAVGAKSVKPEDVIKTAKLYEDHVFGTSNDSVAPAPHIDITTAFDDLDDLPQ